MGITVPAEPDPQAGISLTYAEFLDTVDRLREVHFPIEREPGGGVAALRGMAGQL